MSAPLELGSDLSLRYRYFTRESLAHPAKLHLGLLGWLVDRYTAPGDVIIDPMIGVGSTLYAALLQRHVVGREIELRWLSLAHQNAGHILERAGLFAGRIELGQHDARAPWGLMGDVVLTSPPYGCDAQRTSHRTQAKLAERITRLAASDVAVSNRWHSFATQPALSGAAGLFAFSYGEHPAQIGPLRGARYWQAMEAVYTQARAALRPGGLLILVLKDHIRDGRRVTTAADTVALCARLGFALAARHQRRVYPLSLWQRRRKERGEPIVEEEDVLVFERSG